MVHMYTCVVGSQESGVWVNRLCDLTMGTPRGIKGSYATIVSSGCQQISTVTSVVETSLAGEVSLRVKLRHCGQHKTSHDSIPSLGFTGKVDYW